MATKVLVSEAAPIAQSDAIVINNTWATSDTFQIVSPLNRSFTVTIGSLTTTAQVATTIKEAFNGETLTDTSASVDVNPQDYGEFAELVASVSGSTVTITTIASLRGWPFTISPFATTAGSGGFTHTPTSGTHPGNVTDAENWDTATVPANGDDLIFDERGGDLLFNLANVSVLPATLTFDSSWAGRGGLPPINTNISGKPYLEYRNRWVQWGNSGSMVVVIGEGNGIGTSELWLDVSATELTAHIFRTGPRLNANIPSVVLGGSDPNNKLYLHRGDVGAGLFGKACKLETIRVYYVSNPAADAILECGDSFSSGTTPDWKAFGGRVTLDGTITSGDFQAIGAEATIRGGAFTNLLVGRNDKTQIDGLIRYNGTDNITTVEELAYGVVNFNGNPATKTVTNYKMHKHSKYVDNLGVVTLTNGIVPQGCSINEVEIHRPIGEAWQPV